METESRNGSNGLTAADQLANRPPQIPHVTTNIIPLLNVLRFHTQEAFKQIERLIEKLANTRTTSSDVSRKLSLVDLIVSMRQEFVKIYTLVKWAQRSKDVSKLIDLLNWLRSQEFYFEALSQGINELNHFSGAKLPNSDIPLALEVLVKGRPQLPSYNFIKKPPISPKTILRVLKDLNLALTARMALTQEMPSRFFNNYVVKDGRVVITIPGEFQISITVANDLIIDDPADYHQSPFFFIDFAFLFGINPETSLITHKNSKIVTALPKSSRQKLETVVNQVLLKQSLSGLYDVLHKYSISFKLYLISRQLKDLSVNSKWRGSFQFKYLSSLIIINYWNNQYLSRNWKSFIEIGIDKKYNLNFRWFKNGKYELNHDIPDINGSSLETEDAEDLSVDSILTTIVHKHSEKLMAKIYSQFIKVVSPDAASLVTPHQLVIELTQRKTAILAINPLTGYLYFTDPSPIESQYQTKINSVPSVTESKALVTEQDMIKNVVENLILIRLEMANSFLRTKLITTEWIPNDFIRINENETARLFSFLTDLKLNPSYKLQFFRCRNWPSGWFLIYMITGHSSKIYWWVARTKSIQGEWRLQWLKTLVSEDQRNLDYQFLNRLTTSCSNMIIHHLITEELEQRNVGYMIVEKKDLLQNFKIPVDTSKQSFETVIALHNSGNLLPLSVSSSTIFLVVKLLPSGNSTKLRLTMYGLLEGQTTSDNFSFPHFNIKLHQELNLFELLSSVSLYESGDDINDTASTHKLLTVLFQSVQEIGSLMRVLEQLKDAKARIITHDSQEVSFEINAFYKPFTMALPSRALGKTAKIVADSKEDANVKLLLDIINKDCIFKDTTLAGCFKYLEECVAIFKAAKRVNDSLLAKDLRLPNKLRRLQFDLKFQSLNKVHFVFNVNSVHATAPKKVQKDRIIFAISFAWNKFDAHPRLLFKFSMTENMSAENLKFKKLFEQIFRATNELQEKCHNSNKYFLKLNYDFLTEGEILEPLMGKITDQFIAFLYNEV